MSYLSKIHVVDFEARCKTRCHVQCLLNDFFGRKAKIVFFQNQERLSKAVRVYRCIREMNKHWLDVLPRDIGTVYLILKMLQRKTISFSSFYQYLYSPAKSSTQDDQIRNHRARFGLVFPCVLPCFKPPQTDHCNDSAPASPRERCPVPIKSALEKLKADRDTKDKSKNKNP